MTNTLKTRGGGFRRALLATGAAMSLALGAHGAAEAQSNPTPAGPSQAAPPAASPDSGPQPPTPEAKREASNLPRTFPNQPGVTGDWSGLRTTLSQDGVDFFGSYQMQGGYVTAGKDPGSDFNHQFILGTNLDLQKLIGFDGATFTFAVADRFGHNISLRVGAKVILDGNYGEGETVRLANMSLKQNLFNGRVAYQIGYFPAAAEFDYSPLLCSFLNQGLCGHPNSLGADSSGFQNPPGAQLGGRITFFPRPDLYLKLGAFAVDPPLFSTDYEGFRLGLRDATGGIYLTELGWVPTRGLLNLPGHYKIGAYYDSSAAADVVKPKIMHTGRYNGWIYADQMIWAFDPSARRGLYIFGNATDANRTNSQISTYFSAGFVANGPIAARPNDVLSIGWAKSNLNPRKYDAEIIAKPAFGYYSAEQYYEISYKVQVKPWLFVTPDIQFVKDPGTFMAAKYQDATILGAAVGIAF